MLAQAATSTTFVRHVNVGLPILGVIIVGFIIIVGVIIVPRYLATSPGLTTAFELALIVATAIGTRDTLKRVADSFARMLPLLVHAVTRIIDRDGCEISLGIVHAEQPAHLFGMIRGTAAVCHSRKRTFNIEAHAVLIENDQVRNFDGSLGLQ
jgi:hypothetical protein